MISVMKFGLTRRSLVDAPASSLMATLYPRIHWPGSLPHGGTRRASPHGRRTTSVERELLAPGSAAHLPAVHPLDPGGPTVTWDEFTHACPEIAALARTRFVRDQLVVVGTIRK